MEGGGRVVAVTERGVSAGLAVVGIGCRFPGGANTPELFWDLLRDGVDAIRQIPPDRFDLAELFDSDPATPGRIYTRSGGFVDNIDRFDAAFFGVSPREATRLDPQQRLLLEVVWEALEDGGQPADGLIGSNTGVFIGMSTHDYHDLQVSPGTRHLLDGHSTTGTAMSIAANRISYAYDLRGPSLVVDTACSSSLTAIHLACRSLQRGDCDLAIAGGVNAFLRPDVAIALCKASMLSPDGRCKAFDARANGFVRGEGAAVVILKPLAKARADRDRIYAVVRGSAINQDGHTVGMTVPSDHAQQTLIREALRDAGVDHTAMQYVEAHGTGTRVGDPIEASAIGHVLSTGRPSSRPCLLGSVKTNIGHLEAAAGVAGFVKVALALSKRQIPPSLHFDTPNPAIPFADLRLEVVTTLRPWPVDGQRAVAGVNSFGFGGANAHVVLEEPPASDAPAIAADGGLPHILPVSARHPQALRALVRDYRNTLVADAPALHDLCYTAATRRSHHVCRVAFVGATRDELVEQIDAWLGTDEGESLQPGRSRQGAGPKLAFVFTGMGPQWWGMGRQLLQTEPLFRQAIEECDRLFSTFGSWSLLHELTAGETASRVQDSEFAPAANLAIQVALARLWRAWGIQPDAIVGHSAGEIGAAYAAGALTLHDALLVAFHRGRLQCRARGTGSMLSVGLSADAAAIAIAGIADRVAIAAINSPTSLTLAGERVALEQLAADLTRQGRFNRFVDVDVPYHGPQMDAIRDELLDSLASLSPRPATVSLISTVSGMAIGSIPLDGRYWCENVRRPVRFAAAVDELIRDGYDLFVEVGPHPALSVSISECLSSHGKQGAVLPTLRRREDERRVMLRSLATLYGRGRAVDWTALYPSGRLVAAPRYAWQRERHWFDPGPDVQRDAGIDSGHPLLGYRLTSVRPSWEAALGHPQLQYLQDHSVGGSAVFPGAAYAEIAFAAAREMAPHAPAVIEELAFRRVLSLTCQDQTRVQFLLEADGSSFEIHSRSAPTAAWALHASGKLRLNGGATAPRDFDFQSIRNRCDTEVPIDETYDALKSRGLDYSRTFRGIKAMWRGTGEAVAHIGLPTNDSSNVAPYRVHPALLDSAFQTMLTAAESGPAQASGRHLYLPTSIRRLTVLRDPGLDFWSHARVTRTDGDSLEGDITIVNDAGDVAVAIEGLRCKRLDQTARATRADADDPVYELIWEPQSDAPLVRAATTVRRCVDVATRVQVIADRVAAQQQWVQRLRHLEPTLDALVAHFTRAALMALGWNPREGANVGDDVLASRLRVDTRHRRFFARLLEIVADHPVPDDYAGTVSSERARAAELCERVLSESPENRAGLELLRRSGEQLDRILTGALDAREVLFNPAAALSWSRFFNETPWYGYYNGIVAEAVDSATEDVPLGTPLRILEIGAGTGGTTASVLPRVVSRAAEYHFTDLSRLFLTQARERFRDQPLVHVAALDIEANPIAQLGETPFDVIIAANVLHATADLQTSLRHVRQLLAPGGLLVLLELSRKTGWLDLIFGITEGWWRFADTDVRPAYPLLSAERWRALLRQTGFDETVSVSEPTDQGEPLSAVILATATAVVTPRRIAASAPTHRDARDWLIFSDGQGVVARVADALRSQGDRCVLVHSGEEYQRRGKDSFAIGAESVAHMTRLLDTIAAESFGHHGLIHAWTLDSPNQPSVSASELIDAQRTNCGSVVTVVQAFEQHGRTLPPLWLLTSGAQALGLPHEDVNVAQAPMWGIARALSSEYPDVACRSIDLSPHPEDEEVQALLRVFETEDDKPFEEEIALRGSHRYVSRLRRSSVRRPLRSDQKQTRIPDTDWFVLDVDAPGALESLTLRQSADTRPGSGEVVIRVHAAGLNFRDVMLALGLLPPMAIPGSADKVVLGFECAGVVTDCGAGVDELRPGDEVLAVAVGAFGSHVVTRAEMVVRKPAHLTFAQAATIPLAFITAYYGLIQLASLKAGERVLIHAATGGVGLAAIQLARHVGADIYATAGSPEKRAYLESIGIEHVMDSRSVTFADEVMAATGGEGVDVVLNSLAGDAIAKGISILRPYGRFVELGKRDILANASIGLLDFDRNISFSSVALDRLCFDRPAAVGSMLRQIVQMVTAGTLECLPLTAFDLSQAEHALRLLAQAKHIGKVVLTVSEPTYQVADDAERPLCRPDATYLISGGLGGFGLAVANRMVERGARHIVLMSRSGVPTSANQSLFDRLSESPARVVVSRGDVGNHADVDRTLAEIRATMPPLRGVVHGAMVLEDVPLVQMDADRLRAVLDPKIGGAWNLHLQTATDSLDFFVLFSSLSSVLGIKGQGNYGAANVFLDMLAPYRRSRGLPALVINWGGISDVGYVAQHREVAQHLHRQGMGTFTSAEALDLMEEALSRSVSQLIAARVDWQRWSAVATKAFKQTRRVAHLVATAQQTSQPVPAEATAVGSALASSAPEQRRETLENYIVQRVAKVLGMSTQNVPTHVPFTELGVDSLMAVELQTVLQRDLGRDVPLGLLLEGIDIHRLTNNLLGPMSFDVAAAATLADREDAATAAIGAIPSDAPPTGPPPPEPAPAMATVGGAADGAPVSPSRRRRAVDYQSLDYSRWSPTQRFIQKGVSALSRLVARVDVEGLENFPASGPVILAVNHLSMLDVPLVLTILPRRTICMAADRLQDSWLIRRFLDAGDAIYVHRGEADAEALDDGLAVLRAGGLLGVAPEGTRSRTGGLTRGHSGVAHLAAKANAPILPLVVYGQERLVDNLKRFRRTHLHVRVGVPIAIEPGDKTAAMWQRETDRVMTALAALLPREYRGAYADKVERPNRTSTVTPGTDERGGAHARGRPATADSWDEILADLPGADDPVLGVLLQRRPIGRLVLLLLVRLVRMLLPRVEVSGLHHLPADGAFIISPNHQSFADPFVISGVMPSRVCRQLFFVGHSEHFATRFARWVARFGDCLTIDTDANLVPAMKAAAFGLAHGKILMLFPEGERSLDGTVKPFKKGAPILSRHLGVPIIPVAIHGAYEVWPRNRGINWRAMLPGSGHRIRIAFGAPLRFNDSVNYADAASALQTTVTSMWEELDDAERHRDRGSRGSRGRIPANDFEV
jgi:1-acyl-sn-glycerol-3-phosphate acyltransferase